MFYAYILKSVKDSGYNYGSVSNLELRLKNHIAGKVRSTKGRRTWNLHYYETFDSKKEAVRRELFFKTIYGYNWLRSRKMRIVGSPEGTPSEESHPLRQNYPED